MSKSGCSLALNNGAHALAAPNGFEAIVSVDVADLMAILFTFSHLVFKFETVGVFSDRFHQLREFAFEHAESRVILAAID